MTLRPAIPSDLPAILDFSLSSLPDHIHAKFTHPYHLLHPQEFTSSALSSPRKKLLNPGPNEYNLVITHPDTGEVVAWGFWRRSIGSIHTDKIQKYKSMISSQEFPPHVSSAEAEDINPAASVWRMRLANQCTILDTLNYFEKEHWYLSHLLVSPRHKRKGYGTILTLWGMYYAQRDGVPAYLTASQEGQNLYAKLGWEVVGDRSFPKLEDLSEDERLEEERILGKEEMQEQWRVVTEMAPKVMAWDSGKGLERYEGMIEIIKTVPLESYSIENR